MSRPFFSLIIPTFNEEKLLPRLLTCLKKQTFTNFEIIVVDGRSTDQTKKISQSYPDLKLINSRQRNPGWQRNLGAKKAQGKYLIFIDADTSFPANTLNQIYLFLNRQPVDFLFPKFKFNSSQLGYQLVSFLGDWFFYLGHQFKLNLTNGQFVVVKKAVFHQVKGYNSQLVLSEEHNLLKKIRRAGKKTAYLRKAIVYTSIRRIKKEGLIKFLLKYLYFIVYEHLKGPIKEKPPLAYPMGGSWYD